MADDESTHRPNTSRTPNIKCQNRCTASRIQQFFYSVFPIADWIRHYTAADLIKDCIAGVTVCGIHIPQGITYGNLLAGQSAKYGLYTSFLPVIIYALMGTSRHISAGTYAILCLLIGDSITEIHPDLALNSTAEDLELLYDVRIADVSAMTFYCAVTLLLASLVNAGFLMRYLSVPMMSGFTAGAAIHIFSSQVATLFGLNIPRQQGVGKLVKLYLEIVRRLTSLEGEQVRTTVMSTCLGAGLILFLLGVRKINDRYQKSHFKGIPLPGELMVLVIGTILTYFLRFDDSYNLSIVGDIPKGLPTPKVPNISNFNQMFPPAIPIIVIGYASHMATSNILAIKHGYDKDLRPNQELIALGASNLLGAFFTCLPSFGSIARSCVQDESGAVTQIAAIVSSIILIFVLLVAASLFYFTPKVSLSVIVLVSVTSMIKKFEDFLVYRKVDKIDASVWMVSFLATVFIDVVLGLAISVIFCLVTIILRTQFQGVKLRPRAANEPGDRPRMNRCQQSTSDATILTWNAPLNYLTIPTFRKEFEAKIRKFDETFISSSRDQLATRSPRNCSGGTATSESGVEMCDVTNPDISKQLIILELSVQFTDYTGLNEFSGMLQQYEKNLDIRLVCQHDRLPCGLKRLGKLDASTIDDMRFYSVESALQSLDSQTCSS